MSDNHEYIYIIMTCYQSNDKYSPDYTKIHSLYKTMNEAAEYINKLINEDNYKQYNHGLYYELIQCDFIKKGSLKHPPIYSTRYCTGCCVCREYNIFPPHLES